MTVLTHSGYPGGQRITIATWFKVLDHSAAASGVGAGIRLAQRTDSIDTSDGAGNDNLPGGPRYGFIPLFEWGYDSQTVPNPTGDRFAQSMSNLMLQTSTTIENANARSVLFNASGPFADPINWGIIHSQDFTHAPKYDDSYAAQGTFWYPMLTQRCFSDSRLPGWIDNSWNFLLMSADLSGSDHIEHGNGDAQITAIDQNMKIWMNLNNVFDTTATQPSVGGGPNFLNPSLPGGGLNFDYQGFAIPIIGPPAAGDTPIYDVDGGPIDMMSGEFGMPCISQHARSTYNYARVVNAYTQIWFDLYIEHDSDYQSKFYRRVTVNGEPRLMPPTDIRAAQKAFGPSDIWLYRDKRKKIQYQVNQGTAGPLTVVGSSPADYTPRPGQ